MAVMNPLGSRNIIIIDDNYIGEYSQAYMEVGKQIDDIIIKYIGILKGIIDDLFFCHVVINTIYRKT